MKKRILNLLALCCGFFTSTSAIYRGNETPKQSNDNYLTFTNNSTNSITINLKKNDSSFGTPNVSLVYSTDNGNTWNDFVKETEYTIEAGKSLKVVAGSNGKPGETINKSFNENGKNLTFSFLNSSSKELTDPVISVSGDITSLLNGVGGDVDLSSTEGGANYEKCFQRLFKTCKCITTAPNLPSTKLAVACYGALFSECSSLVSAPSLPATTLATSCYSNMFSSCSSLVSAPSLPATTLTNQCYSQMFSSCSSLVSAPSLPATKLKQNCYDSMFIKCTSLVKIPDLSHVVSIIDPSLSNMFKGCTKLSITSTGTKNWSIGTSSTTGTIPSTMFDSCTNVNFGSGSKTPIKGTKYHLGISGISFEMTSLSGYYKKDGNKQAICAFGASCITDNLESITEFGFSIYNGTSYVDTLKSEETDQLVSKGGRFYTIIDCDGAGVTKKIKAYAKINSTRYTSSPIYATSNLDNEYSASL